MTAGVYCLGCGAECASREHRSDSGRVIGVTWGCNHCRTATLVGKRRERTPEPVVSGYNKHYREAAR